MVGQRLQYTVMVGQRLQPQFGFSIKTILDDLIGRVL